MSPSVSATLADLRQRFGQLYGRRLARMVLFGSQARGDARDGSDVDLLVVLTGPVSPSVEIERTMADVAAVSLANGVAVACVFVSSEQYEREKSPLLLNVRREGVPV